MLSKLRGHLEDLAAIDLELVGTAERAFLPLAAWVARVASLVRMAWLALLIVHIAVAVILGILLARTYGVSSFPTLGIEGVFSGLAWLIWWVARSYTLFTRFPQLLSDVASCARIAGPIARDAVLRLRQSSRWQAAFIMISAAGAIVIHLVHTLDPHEDHLKRLQVSAVLVLTPIGWLLQLLALLMVIGLWGAAGVLLLV